MIGVAGQSKPRLLSRSSRPAAAAFRIDQDARCAEMSKSGTSRHFSAVRNLVAIGGIPDLGEWVRPADLWVHALVEPLRQVGGKLPLKRNGRSRASALI